MDGPAAEPWWNINAIDPMSNMIRQIMALFDEFATEDARRAEVAIAVRPKFVRVS